MTNGSGEPPEEKIDLSALRLGGPAAEEPAIDLGALKSAFTSGANVTAAEPVTFTADEQASYKQALSHRFKGPSQS